MSYILTNPFISKFIIISNSSLVLIKWLYTLCKSAVYIIFAALNLILDYLSLTLAMAVYRGFPTGRFLPYILCDPCIPVRFSDII